jgi:hypothetical protein
MLLAMLWPFLVKLDLQGKHAKNKHSSLFCLNPATKKTSFIALTPFPSFKTRPQSNFVISPKNCLFAKYDLKSRTGLKVAAA